MYRGLHALKPCMHSELIDFALKFKCQFLTMLFQMIYRSWNEEAEAQYEYLQFHGTIINLSNKQIGGTGDLSWGKWMRGGSPQFPINPGSHMTFKSQGVSL